MRLTNRLATVASKVPCGVKVADIGTDHAYIPVFLVKNNISNNVIASDVKKGPLDIAKKCILQNNMSEYIQTRLGYGLSVLKPYEVDTVIIAGMGGMLIRDILDQSKEICNTIKTFILQPMIAQDILREWLNSNNYKIIDETLAKEGNKMYTILVVQHGYESIENKIYFDIGKKLIENKDPLLKEYIKKKIIQTKRILNSLKGQTTCNSQKKRLEVESKLDEYYELLKNISKEGEISDEL